MIRTKTPAGRRLHAVMVRLSDSERTGLDFLRERESLPGALILRRLLIQAIREHEREPLTRS
jgi:hypothetical protein